MKLVTLCDGGGNILAVGFIRDMGPEPSGISAIHIASDDPSDQCHTIDVDESMTKISLGEIRATMRVRRIDESKAELVRRDSDCLKGDVT